MTVVAVATVVLIGYRGILTPQSPESDPTGSKASCIKIVQKTLDLLGEFEIPYEVRVCSAHRSPEAAHDYATGAEERGLKVIIAAAGLAAHLAGVMASLTPLPVIGIPVAAGPLQGLDALLATVQMPPGVPVATVALGEAGAANAAVLAAQIIGVGDETVRERVRAYKATLAEKVEAKNVKLQEKLGG